MNIRKTKGIFGVLLSICISMFFLGCNFIDVVIKNTSSAGKEIPGWELDKSPITFKWYIDFSWFKKQWGQDLTSQYVTKKTGVSIDFITPTSDTGDNFMAKIANEDLPDFITIEQWNDSTIDYLIENNLVYSLDDLAEKYDVYFTKVADVEKLEWYRRENGKVYEYPNSSITFRDFEENKQDNVSNQTFLVRKDIYEAIGRPDMRTPEGFLDALVKAKELFPEVDGKELIPIGLHSFTESGNYSLESYIQNFLAIPYEVNGKLYDRYTDKEYIRWLKTFRSANELGLLAPDIFIDKKLQIEEKISQGRYFALLYQGSDMVTQQLELYKNNPDTIYIPIEGPANSKLDEPTLECSESLSGWTVTLISKGCKNPERAIRFLSYLISEEGNKDLYLGEKGVTWDIIDGKEQFKPDVEKLLVSNRSAFDEIYGAAHKFWMLMDGNIIKRWMPKDIEPIKDIREWSKGKVYNYSIYKELTPKGNNDIALIDKQIGGVWGEVLFRLITAESEDVFDKIFADFVRLRDELGYEKVMEYKQTKLEENKKKIKENLQ